MRIVACVAALLLVQLIIVAAEKDSEAKKLVKGVSFQGGGLGPLLRSDRKKFEAAMQELAKASAKDCEAAFYAGALANVPGLESGKKSWDEKGVDYLNTKAWYLLHARSKSGDGAVLDCWLDTPHTHLWIVNSHLKWYRLDTATLKRLRDLLAGGTLGEDHAEMGLELLNRQLASEGLTVAEITERWTELTAPLLAAEKEYSELAKRKPMRMLKEVDVGEASWFDVDPTGRYIVGREKSDGKYSVVLFDARTGKRGKSAVYFDNNVEGGIVAGPRISGDGKYIVLWGSTLRVLDTATLKLVHEEALDSSGSPWRLSQDLSRFYKCTGDRFVVRALIDPTPIVDVPLKGQSRTLFAPNLEFCARESGDAWELIELATGSVVRTFNPQPHDPQGLTDNGEWLIDSRGKHGCVAVSTRTGVDCFQFAHTDTSVSAYHARSKVIALSMGSEAWFIAHANSGRILGVAASPGAEQRRLVGTSADGTLLVAESWEGDENAAAKSRSTGNPDDSKPLPRIQRKLYIWSAN